MNQKPQTTPSNTTPFLGITPVVTKKPSQATITIKGDCEDPTSVDLTSMPADQLVSLFQFNPALSSSYSTQSSITMKLSDHF